MAPVILRIKRRRAIILGLSFGFFGLFFLLLALIPLAFGTFIGGFIAMALFLGLPFTAGAVFFFGVAYQRPVALRMDAGGISGFYADTASWDEIASVGVTTGPKGHKFLGFALHDPIGFRDRQSPWRRFKSWDNGRASGYHLIVPEILLQDGNADDLAQKGATFLHAHRDVT